MKQNKCFILGPVPTLLNDVVVKEAQILIPNRLYSNNPFPFWNVFIYYSFDGEPMLSYQCYGDYVLGVKCWYNELNIIIGVWNFTKLDEFFKTVKEEFLKEKENWLLELTKNKKELSYEWKDTKENKFYYEN